MGSVAIPARAGQDPRPRSTVGERLRDRAEGQRKRIDLGNLRGRLLGRLAAIETGEDHHVRGQGRAHDDRRDKGPSGDALAGRG